MSPRAEPAERVDDVPQHRRNPRLSISGEDLPVIVAVARILPLIALTIPAIVVICIGIRFWLPRSFWHFRVAGVARKGATCMLRLAGGLQQTAKWRRRTHVVPGPSVSCIAARATMT